MHDHSLSPLWTHRFFSRWNYTSFPNYYLFFLALLSGSFLGLAWCSVWFGWLFFVAIIPKLLIIKISDMIGSRKCVYSLSYIFLSLLVWNGLTIWWVYKAAVEAVIFTILYSTLCLFMPWIFFYYMRKWGGIYIGYMALVTCWLTLEYAHLTWEFWELTFPWLNLGNGLAALPQWIQWYEYTGIQGGSLWILTFNILLYHLFFEKNRSLLLKGCCCVLFLPLLISFISYYGYKEKGTEVEVVIAQPNLDSYTEKDPGYPTFVPYRVQIERLLSLSRGAITPSTVLVVWPESAINEWINEATVDRYPLLQPVWKFMEQYPEISLVAGASSYRIYDPAHAPPTSRLKKGYYIGYFNSIFHFKYGSKVVDIYHKWKRLPGAEFIPYLHLFSDQMLSWIQEKFAQIGNIDPCLSPGNGSKVFAVNDQIKVAPINCYESLYGAFVGKASQKGATLLAVLTNDGWWGNTTVYDHHFQYSRLLAIAHRKSVVRAANTGISGFINQRGDIIAKANQLELAAMRKAVYSHPGVTFYALYGDYIGYIASCIVLLLICSWFISIFKSKLFLFKGIFYFTSTKL